MKHYLRLYLHSHAHLAQFLRFATVGVKVSIIDIGGVYLLPWLFGLSLYSARVISLTTAIMAGYVLNRYFTFGRARRGGFYRQMAGHFGVHLTGGVINYGIFSLLIVLGHRHLNDRFSLSLLPLAAVWGGGMVGMLFNFFASRRFVFPAPAPGSDGQP